MSISVTCTNCGKGLKVKDEWAGKKAKCPGCGTSFVVGAAGATPAARGKSGSAPAKKPKGPGIAVNWGLVIGLAAVLIVGIVLVVYFVGQSGAKAKWAEMVDKADDDVKSVISTALQARLSADGEYDPRKSTQTPGVHDLTFVWSMFALSLPDKIPFFGQATTGEFKGKFDTKTQEVEVDLEVGGTTLVTGVQVGKSTGKIHVTGRRKANQTTVEIDGQKAEIVYRKTMEELQDEADHERGEKIKAEQRKADEAKAKASTNPTTKPAAK